MIWSETVELTILSAVFRQLGEDLLHVSLGGESFKVMSLTSTMPAERQRQTSGLVLESSPHPESLTAMFQHTFVSSATAAVSLDRSLRT